MLALGVPITFVGLAGLLLEYRATGYFDWVVDRDQPRDWDWLLALGVFGIMFGVMPAYCAVCWSRNKPTPGSCIANYRVVSDEPHPMTFMQAYLRALLGSVALLAWPAWILAAFLKRDKMRGKFWLDAVFKTHAEYLT